MNEVNGDYNAVEFSYNSASVGEKERGEGKGEEPVLFDQPQMQEHLSTSYADQPEDGGEYERPFRLFLPPNIITVSNNQRVVCVLNNASIPTLY